MSVEQTYNWVDHSSIRPYMNDRDRDDIYVPGRSLFYGCFDRTSVLLPDIEGIHAFQSDFVRIAGELGIPAPQTVVVEGDHYLQDVNILNNLDAFVKVLSKEVPYLVHPYARYPELDEWVNRLASAGYTIDVDMSEHKIDPRHVQSRGGWARWVDNPNTLSFPEQYNIPYPVSYCGQGLEQVREAYERVTVRTGDNKVVFKPVFSAGGSTISYASSVEEVEEIYTNMQRLNTLMVDGVENPIEIQERLVIRELYSYQYVGDVIITPGMISTQYTEGEAWRGNGFNGFSSNLQNEAATIFNNFKRGMQKKYPGERLGKGGKDLALVEGRDELITIEHNGGRITGAHIPIDFNRLLGFRDNAFLSMMIGSNPQCGLSECWRFLKQNKLALDIDKANGVFPLGWFEGCTLIYSTGRDIEEAEKNYNRAHNALLKECLLIENHG